MRNCCISAAEPYRAQKFGVQGYAIYAIAYSLMPVSIIKVFHKFNYCSAVLCVLAEFMVV